jgi:hypothetical protein
MSKKNEQKERKRHIVRPAGLKTRRSFSYTTRKNNSISSSPTGPFIETIMENI